MDKQRPGITGVFFRATRSITSAIWRDLIRRPCNLNHQLMIEIDLFDRLPHSQIAPVSADPWGTCRGCMLPGLKQQPECQERLCANQVRVIPVPAHSNDCSGTATLYRLDQLGFCLTHFFTLAPFHLHRLAFLFFKHHVFLVEFFPGRLQQCSPTSWGVRTAAVAVWLLQSSSPAAALAVRGPTHRIPRSDASSTDWISWLRTSAAGLPTPSATAAVHGVPSSKPAPTTPISPNTAASTIPTTAVLSIRASEFSATLTASSSATSTRSPPPSTNLCADRPVLRRAPGCQSFHKHRPKQELGENTKHPPVIHYRDRSGQV